MFRREKGLNHSGVWIDSTDSPKKSRSKDSLILSAASLPILGAAVRLMSRKRELEVSGCVNREEAPSVPAYERHIKKVEGSGPRSQWITTERLALSHQVYGKKGLSKGKTDEF